MLLTALAALFVWLQSVFQQNVFQDFSVFQDFTTSVANSTSPVVKIGPVRYLGVQNAASGVKSFYGIRYAEPPTKDLRWRPPVPKDPAQAAYGVVNVTAHGPMCLQSVLSWLPPPAESVTSDESEDCLLLDVQVPVKPQNSKLPVLVNIHGGGYVAGRAAEGDSIVHHAQGQMVYVAIQYRLGAFGFLGGPAVAVDGTWNAGLLDQRLAIDWVKKYIHHFGGDPDQITITGGSAGGASVTLQMILEGGSEDPSFRAAIPQCPWWTPIYNSSWVNDQYEELLGAANCTELSCLRSMSATSLQNAVQRTADKAYRDGVLPYGLYYWGPTLDGTIIRDYPLNEFQNGHFTKVPLMVDHNSFEAWLFVYGGLKTDQEVTELLERLWPAANDSYIEEVFQQYPSSTYNATIMDGLALVVNPSDAYARMHAIFGDIIVNCATAYVSEAVTKAGLTAYKMLFDAGTKIHGASSDYIYSSLINPDGTTALGPGNAMIARYLRDYVVSFTLHLDPNQYAYDDQPPHWPARQLNETNTLHVTDTSFTVQRDADQSQQCAFFRDTPAEAIGI